MKLQCFFLCIYCTHFADPAYFSQFSLRKPDQDPCYDTSGRPIRCVPEFINAAFGKPVVASETCGSQNDTRFCYSPEVKNNRAKKCFTCQSHIRSNSYSASLLTDIHSNRNPTCWVSEPIRTQRSVNLTLSLGKKFELTYISLQFCFRVPDSIALYKSADYGKTWIPYQYYSSDCMHVYGKSPNSIVGKENEQEAVCSDISNISNESMRLAFPLIENRPSALNFESSPTLQDWVTATDIKIVLNRLIHENMEKSANEDHIESNENYYFYSVGEIAVGGRCKCNGHASRCFINARGKYACDCRHNTDGIECETCKPFYFDRPWRRATSFSSNSCSVCNCNMHSKKCRFVPKIYAMSGQRSGGVCLNCRHNTAGRNCHLCKPGFFRDSKVHLTNRKSCKKCNCHPIGSLGKSCNQETGHCVCKAGVTGQTCNRCIEGYHQSRSSSSPCIKFTTKNNWTKINGTNNIFKADCSHCFLPVKLSMRKFCNRDYAYQAVVNAVSHGRHGFTKIGFHIEGSYKRNETILPQKILSIPTASFFCQCAKLQIGKRFLLLGKQPDKITNELLFNSKIMIAELNLPLKQKESLSLIFE